MIKKILVSAPLILALAQLSYASNSAIVRVTNKIKVAEQAVFPSFPAVAFFTLGNDEKHHPVHANNGFVDIQIEPNQTYLFNVLHMIFGNTDQTCISKSCKDLKITLKENEIINIEIHTPPHDEGGYGMLIRCEISNNFMKW